MPSSCDDEAGGSPAGRRRGRSSTQRQRDELIDVVPAGRDAGRRRGSST